MMATTLTEKALVDLEPSATLLVLPALLASEALTTAEELAERLDLKRHEVIAVIAALKRAGLVAYVEDEERNERAPTRLPDYGYRVSNHAALAATLAAFAALCRQRRRRQREPRRRLSALAGVGAPV